MRLENGIVLEKEAILIKFYMSNFFSFACISPLFL